MDHHNEQAPQQNQVYDQASEREPGQQQHVWRETEKSRRIFEDLLPLAIRGGGSMSC